MWLVHISTGKMTLLAKEWGNGKWIEYPGPHTSYNLQELFDSVAPNDYKDFKIEYESD